MNKHQSTSSKQYSTAVSENLGSVFCSVTLVRNDSNQSNHSNLTKCTIFSIVNELQQEKVASESRGEKKLIACWPKAEVKKLQKLVNEYGTDFFYISKILGKSRDQIKRKFKIMQKKNPNFGFAM